MLPRAESGPQAQGHPAADRALRLPLLLVPWGAVLLTILGWAAAPGVFLRLAFVPLLLSGVLLGLPHGALDHLVPGRLGWAWGCRPGPLLAYLTLYAALAGAVLLLWRAAPLLSYWLFLAASLLHWGQGDLHLLDTSLGRRRVSKLSGALTVLVRGALPILVPLLVFPEWFDRLALGAARLSGGALPAAGLPEPLRTGLWIAFGVLLLLYVLDAWFAAARPALYALDLFEVALLLLLFCTVPAPLAIGVYFVAWHAWRHLGRLLLLRRHDAELLRSGRWRVPILRLARDLTPITVLALLMLAGLYLAVGQRVHSLEDLSALYLAFISALTVPHALLVALMDVPGRTYAQSD